MTIEDSTQQLGMLDLDDLDDASAAVLARGRAVVESAAGADPQSLLAARVAGELLIERLLDERRRLLAEIANARCLQGALSANVQDDHTPGSLLGLAVVA